MRSSTYILFISPRLFWEPTLRFTHRHYLWLTICDYLWLSVTICEIWAVLLDVGVAIAFLWDKNWKLCRLFWLQRDSGMCSDVRAIQYKQCRRAISSSVMILWI